MSSVAQKKLAESGNAEAQYRLGLMRARGDGIFQNIVGAHMWLSIAGANDFYDAVGERDGLAKKLTGEQLEKANERPKRCMESDYRGATQRLTGWWIWAYAERNNR